MNKLKRSDIWVWSALLLMLCLGDNSQAGERVRELKGNKLQDCGTDPASLSLNAEKRLDQAGAASYTLILENYVGDIWVFVRDDTESLVITADGEEMRFKPRDIFCYRKQRYAKELTYYDIGEGALKKIAAAKKVDIKITCVNFTLKRCFNKGNFEKLREFIAK